MKETRSFEVKERVTNTFLKTVSAYANFGDGIIRFGITDDGKFVGIEDAGNACLDIENRINDSISPVLDYRISVDDDTNVITLEVKEGSLILRGSHRTVGRMGHDFKAGGGLLDVVVMAHPAHALPHILE